MSKSQPAFTTKAAKAEKDKKECVICLASYQRQLLWKMFTYTLMASQLMKLRSRIISFQSNYLQTVFFFYLFTLADIFCLSLGGKSLFYFFISFPPILVRSCRELMIFEWSSSKKTGTKMWNKMLSNSGGRWCCLQNDNFMTRFVNLSSTLSVFFWLCCAVERWILRFA